MDPWAALSVNPTLVVLVRGPLFALRFLRLRRDRRSQRGLSILALGDLMRCMVHDRRLAAADRAGCVLAAAAGWAQAAALGRRADRTELASASRDLATAWARKRRLAVLFRPAVRYEFQHASAASRTAQLLDAR